MGCVCQTSLCHLILCFVKPTICAPQVTGSQMNQGMGLTPQMIPFTSETLHLHKHVSHSPTAQSHTNALSTGTSPNCTAQRHCNNGTPNLIHMIHMSKHSAHQHAAFTRAHFPCLNGAEGRTPTPPSPFYPLAPHGSIASIISM